MNDSQRQKRVEKAQYRILFNAAFFAPGVARLPVRFDASVPTACTDGKEIVWNPEFFDKLPDECLPMVLAHETAHCLLGHLWRMPVGGDSSTWNIACDHAVNLMLEEFGKLRTAQNLADPFPFPKDFPALKDPKFAGMCEEQIYGLLSNKGGGSGSPPQAPPGAGGAKGNQPGQSGGQPGKAPPAPGKAQGGGGQKPSIGEFKPSPGNPAQQKQSKTEWDSTLMQSAAMCKGRGSLPGSVQRAVGDLLNPKVSWQELLRNFLREQVADDYNWMKPNRYFDECGFILPSLDSEAMGAVVFAVDSSGSIDRELLTEFKTEMQSALDDLKPSKLVEIVCDTRITVHREYSRGDKVLPDAPGGGGTSFVPVFDKLADEQRAPKCVVYLTDLDGQFPDKAPDYPVLWVSYGTEKQAPFGETVRVG